MRTVVVLPARFRPRNPQTSPSATSRSTPSTALIPPSNSRASCCVSIAATVPQDNRRQGPAPEGGHTPRPWSLRALPSAPKWSGVAVAGPQFDELAVGGALERLGGVEEQRVRAPGPEQLERRGQPAVEADGDTDAGNAGEVRDHALAAVS